MKKLGLALGAGAARGAAHIGFLRVLEEENIKPDYIAGCSMGAIVGAAYASGMPLGEIQRIVDKLRLMDFFSPTAKKGGLFSMQKIHRLIEKHLGKLQFENLKIPFQCIATDIISRKLITFSTGNVVDAIVASANVPFLFAPIERNGMRLIDGYILDRVPVMTVKTMGADVIVALDALGERPFGSKNPASWQMGLEIMDILECERAKWRKQEHAKDIDFWLEYDLGDMGHVELKKIRFACERGYALGKEHVQAIKKALR
ncbi:MAG: patatin-like phospholipase family protein [Clostridia bacterium]|nr:patatin-like phospholipase family protein [Clostridia bacterium]